MCQCKRAESLCEKSFLLSFLGATGDEESRATLGQTRIEIPRFALSKITSFPRKRESIGLTMGPRFRGDDNADFHSYGWAAGPWALGMTARSKFSHRILGALQ